MKNFNKVIIPINNNQFYGNEYDNKNLIYKGILNKNYEHDVLGCLYKNGKIIYNGSFVNGVCDGYGEQYDENGKLIYEGYFKNNLYNGKGYFYLENFCIYGDFKDGIISGNIIIHTNNVINYIGDYNDFMKINFP